jgi:xanthine dehydrogenase accessory factor
VRADGTALGSLSGGCVESAVHDAVLRSLGTRRPSRHVFDHDSDDPFAVGLTCGGQIEVYVHPFELRRDTAVLDAWRATVNGQAVALVRVLETGEATVVRPAEEGGGAAVAAEARALLAQGRSGVREVCRSGRADEVFIESWNTPPRMLVFGAIDHATALTRIGSFLGYRVTVCDARSVFATPQRFPEADEVVVQWPHKYLRDTEIHDRTVICVLTHDANFDVPVLQEALGGQAAYVGALGSRRTHADRLRRLRATGVAEDSLARLRSPIGLDLGGRTPEETAVSIAAEIVATRTGAGTRPLSDGDGPIHG